MPSRRLAALALFLVWLFSACTPQALSSTPPGSTPSPTPQLPAAQPVTTPNHPSSTPSIPSTAIEAVFSQVEHLRGLQAHEGIPFAGASPSEITLLAQEELLVNWPLSSLQREARLLAHLGFPAAGLELDDLMAALGLDALLAASSPDGGLSISTSLAAADSDLTQVAWAYDRLLIAQAHSDADPGREFTDCADNVDACLAGRALLVGDAALLAEQWRRTYGASPPVVEGGLAPAAPLPAAQGAAAALVPVLAFPEEHGLDFVRSLFLEGGWAAVDQAYASPPISTEQILHPERYPKDTPRPPHYPDPASALGEGWGTVDTGILGEWRTRLLLEAYLNAEAAEEAAEGWDGDQYALLTDEEGLRALVLLTRWDTVRDAHEFSTAFRSYGENRFGAAKRSGTSLTWTVPTGLIILDVGNDQTLWIEAPDAAMAEALREATRFPLH